MPARRAGCARGKLRAAARRWAGGRGGEIVSNDPLTVSARLPDRRKPEAEQELELVRDEAEAFSLFLALDTQWRRCPMTGLRLGLDYLAIEPTARMLEIQMAPRMLTDLRIMEAAAIERLAEQARRTR